MVVFVEEPGSSSPLSVKIVIAKSLQSFPLRGPTAYSPWVGNLTGGNTKTVLSDLNLFDGVSTYFITPQSFSLNVPNLVTSSVLNTAAEVGLRLTPLSALPATLPVSIRGAFLRPLGTKWTTSVGEQGVLRGAKMASDQTGGLYQLRTSCSGATCPDYITSALRSFVQGAVIAVCPTYSFVSGTLESSIESHLFFTKSATSSNVDGVVMLGMYAYTRVLVDCSGKGFISVYLSAENGGPSHDGSRAPIPSHGPSPSSVYTFRKYKWPIDAFTTTISNNLVRSVPLVTRGFISGSVMSSGLL